MGAERLTLQYGAMSVDATFNLLEMWLELGVELFTFAPDLLVAACILRAVQSGDRLDPMREKGRRCYSIFGCRQARAPNAAGSRNRAPGSAQTLPGAWRPSQLRSSKAIPVCLDARAPL